MDYNLIFFKLFFVLLKGNMKVMDTYLGGYQAHTCNTVKSDYNKFHWENEEDPNWLLKTFITLMVVAALNVEWSIDNLWKAEKLSGL